MMPEIENQQNNFEMADLFSSIKTEEETNCNNSSSCNNINNNNNNNNSSCNNLDTSFQNLS